MRSFKMFGVAGVAFASIAAIIVATTAWGQDAGPIVERNPVELRAQTAVPAPPGVAPADVRFYYGAAGGWGHASEAGAGQLQQASSELARQTEALVSKYGEAAKDEDREKIKTELAELLAKQFGVQQQIREEEVAQIEARVKKLRELIEKRKAAQKSIIERRLDQLLRDAEGLGWIAATPDDAHQQWIRGVRPVTIAPGRR